MFSLNAYKLCFVVFSCVGLNKATQSRMLKGEGDIMTATAATAVNTPGKESEGKQHKRIFFRCVCVTKMKVIEFIQV